MLSVHPMSVSLLSLSIAVWAFVVHDLSASVTAITIIIFPVPPQSRHRQFMVSKVGHWSPVFTFSRPDPLHFGQVLRFIISVALKKIPQ
jgi:hypothetical protein